MACIQLRPPNQFNFHYPDLWPWWKQCYEEFHVTSGLFEESGERQVSTLLYCKSLDAKKMLHSIGTTTTKRKDYKTVIDNFDEYFGVQKNVIYERAKFNSWRQKPGETGEQYFCSIQSSRDRQLQHSSSEGAAGRLVIGIQNAKLSKHLQMDPRWTWLLLWTSTTV